MQRENVYACAHEWCWLQYRFFVCVCLSVCCTVRDIKVERMFPDGDPNTRENERPDVDTIFAPPPTYR